MVNNLKTSAKKNYIPIIFLAIMSLLFTTNAFPSLYGDEYGSLFDSTHLTGNIHAIGYFVQLNLWNRISDQDWFLRILSLLWFAVGIFWLNQWLKSEDLPRKVAGLLILLITINPFLWLYSFQIRFYTYFFAASIFWIWRFRAWQMQSNRRNFLLFLLSLSMLLTSHLFGVLVVLAVAFSFLWDRFGKKRWYLFGGLLFTFILIIFSPIRQILIELVFRVSNPYATVLESVPSRGVSLAMFAKIPLAFYFFLLGERVYPLWWWITVPSLLISAVVFLAGLLKICYFRKVGVLTVFMLLSIPLLFLVLDPLAPSELQGAVPRYLIFVIPYFLLTLAFGAQSWKFMPHILIMTSLVGIFFLAWPQWSYGQSDLMNWPLYLQKVVVTPQETCILTDGRAEISVLRYAPVQTKIVRDNLDECLGFSRLILVTNDYRPSVTRDFDKIVEKLRKDYILAYNMTLFPAQITVFDKSSSGSFGQIIPSRLDLPEQDLRFPILLSNKKDEINGFVRLDSQRPFVEIFPLEDVDGLMQILSNYRSNHVVASATPVFSLQFITVAGEQKEIILKAEKDTSSWDGKCITCSEITSWMKLVHLVGSYSYPGAYRQYEARVWGTPIKIGNIKPDSFVKISYLLSDGTGYIYGLQPTQK
jgi:hypothetical protein